MTSHDVAALEDLLKWMRKEAMFEDGDSLSSEQVQEFIYVLESAIRGAAELAHLRGICNDAVEDSLMYQRGIAEGRRLERLSVLVQMGGIVTGKAD